MFAKPQPSTARDSKFPPPPETEPGYEFGRVLTSMVARYGAGQRLPEPLTREIFKDTSPELLANVPLDKLRRAAFLAMVQVDSNAHMNPGWSDPGIRQHPIRQFAEGLARRP